MNMLFLKNFFYFFWARGLYNYVILVDKGC